MLPTFLQPTHPLAANNLVTVWQVTDTRTDTDALLYRTTAPTAPALSLAQEALEQLRSALLPAIPAVTDTGEDEIGNRWLMLRLPEGAFLQNRVLALSPLSEIDLLSVAEQHLQVLSAVHQAGYCGLRPAVADLWWDADSEQLVVMGWEWLVIGDEETPGDLRAAAATWIELATCAPPGANLSMASGPASWLALSAGMRGLLFSLWQDRGPDSVSLALQQVSTLRDYWQQDTETLLTQGEQALDDDPVYALEMLDIARRTSSSPAEVDQTYMIAKGQAHGHAEALIVRGRRDFGLGHYTPARNTFLRVSALPQASSEHLIMAARWAAVAQALTDAVEKNISEYGLPAREMESKLVLVMDFVVEEAFDAARDALEKLIQKIPNSIVMPALRALERDLRAHQLWQTGREAEEMGKIADARNMYAGAMEELEGIPASYYPLRLMEESIRPALVRAERLVKQRKYIDMKYREGKIAYGRKDYARAETLFLKAGNHAVPWPAERSKYLEYTFRTRLRREVKRWSIISSDERWTTAWLQQAEKSLIAVQDLLSYCPEEVEGEFALSVRNRWHEALLRADILDADIILEALHLLERFWGQNKALRALSTKAVNKQLTHCKQQLEALGAEKPRGTKEHQRVTKDLIGSEHTLHNLKRFATPAECKKLDACLVDLSNMLTRLGDRLQTIQSLRKQYEQLLLADGSAQSALNEAREQGLELFDGSVINVTQLLEIDELSQVQSRRLLKNLLLQLAGHALATGHTDIAASIYGISGDEQDYDQLSQALTYWGKTLTECIQTSLEEEQ